MKLRQSKKMCKTAMRKMKLQHVRTIKRLYIVKPKPNFVCMRWYAFTVTTENNPKIDLLIAEQEVK